MERQLPVLDLKGTDFFVDVLHEELQQKSNPENRISFNAFYQEGDGYTLLYDHELKNTPDDPSSITENNGRYEWITIPALMELDPVGIALKYDIPLDILCPDLDVNSFDLFNEEDDDEP